MPPDNASSNLLSSFFARLSRISLRKIIRRLEHALFWVAVLLSGLYLLLQMPAVQNGLIATTSRILSAELNNTVSIRHVDIQFFDNLLLEGLYVTDQERDTLLYTERLSAGLRTNIFSLVRNKLELNELALYGAHFHLMRKSASHQNNLQFLIDFFSSDTKREKEPSPFFLRIQNIRLRDLTFEQDDLFLGKRMLAYLNNGVLRLQGFETPKNIFHFKSVLLDGLRFEVSDRLTAGDTLQLPERPEELTAVDSSLESIEADTLWFHIDRFALNNGLFELNRFDLSEKGVVPDSVMDYEHLWVEDIAFKADSIRFNDQLEFAGTLRHLAANSSSGLKVQHLEARQVMVNDTITSLYGMKLETAGSVIGDSLALRYNSYHDYQLFVDRVNLDLRIKPGSKLLLRDITQFSAPLARNLFFKNNINKTANLRGHFNGRINRLNGRDLLLELGESTYYEGDLDLDDAARGPDLVRLQLNCKQLQSNMNTLRSIIPGFSAPSQFNKLGNFSFSGKYLLLFGFNHILNGKLNSDVGYGTLDMELDLTEGRDKATYSGALDLNNFNMAAWTDNPDFGKSSFRVSIAEGSSGLRLSSLKTKINGVVDTLIFKGYPYANIEMDANLNGYNMTGEVSMKDPNIDITIKGRADLSDSVKVFDFEGNVQHARLLDLKLMDKDWEFSGKTPHIQLKGSSVDNISGSATFSDLNLRQDSSYAHHLDSMYLESVFLPDSSRRYTLYSDIADGYLEGQLRLTQLPLNLSAMFLQYFPNLSRKVGLTAPDSLLLADVFDFNLRVKDTKDLTRLVAAELDTIKELVMLGRVDQKLGFSELKLDIPEVRYGDLSMKRVDFKWHSLRSVADYDFLLPETTMGGGRKLAPVRLYGSTQNDALNFTIQAQDTAFMVRSIDLNGNLSVVDSLWQLTFNTSNIQLFNEEWVMDDRNYLRFGDGYFDAQEFELMNGNQRITFYSSNENKGMLVTTTNLNLNYLNRFIPDSNMHVEGNIYDLDCRIEDLYHMKGIQLSVNTDTVFLNGQSYGILQGDIGQNTFSEPLLGKVFLRQASSMLRLNAGFSSENIEPYFDDELKTINPGEFQSTLTATNFPVSVLEVFVPGISNTSGTFDLEARMGGSSEKPDLKGSVLIKEGKIEIDYLKTPVYLRHQTIQLTNTQIWAEGDTLWDATLRNPAIVHGGLRHNRFTDWQIQCSVESLNDQFLVMNTRKEDNELFYGQARGRFRANFSGTFSKPNVSVSAINGPGTKLFIPLSSDDEVKQASFIQFTNGQESANGNRRVRYNANKITGLNFELNISVNNRAEVQLIFDEQTGDIIKGSGFGDLRMAINREGDFKMYGNYTIDQGEYLFTLLNLINKPFKVEQGGTINWFGDPYQAQIQLDAIYEASSSLFNLLRAELELTQSEELAREASRPTKVIVTMHLNGELFKPTITFDMSFPQLGTQMRTLADNKLRTMQADQNELTRQVFGIVVVGTFLPPENTFGQSSDYVTTAFNTFSQVLTNQLSNYLTGLATEWFGGTVSSIDLDIMYSEYRNDIINQGQANSNVGRELQVRLSSGFADDRVIVNIGSQFGSSQTPGTAIQEGFLGQDVSVEIALTESGQWRLRVFQRTEPDVAGGQWRYRVGFGLSFRKEYDSFLDLMDGLTGWMKKK
jgi:hypothetical protein